MFQHSLLWKSSSAYDVVISGSGIVGAASAAAIQWLNYNKFLPSKNGNFTQTVLTARPLRSVLVERSQKPPLFNPRSTANKIRTVALSRVNMQLLDNLCGWEAQKKKESEATTATQLGEFEENKILKEETTALNSTEIKIINKHPYYRMAVRHENQQHEEGRSATFFTSPLFGGRAPGAPALEFMDLNTPLGYICYNDELQARIIDKVDAVNEVFAQANESDSAAMCVERRWGADVKVLSYPGVEEDSGELVRLSLAKNSEGVVDEVSTRLIVGCEGRGSALRGVLSTPSFEYDYNQHGFVASVVIDASSTDGNHCCFQNFFNDGSIIGYLPTSPRTANIVYSINSHSLARLQKASNGEIVDILNAALHALAPHDIPMIKEVLMDENIEESCTEAELALKHSHLEETQSSHVCEGGVCRLVEPSVRTFGRAVGSFPLKLAVATKPYQARMLLLGDAAHGVHPMAGQGLNLGLYDVIALADALHFARAEAGADVGSAINVGRRVATQMLVHAGPVIGGVEAIKRMMRGAPQTSLFGMGILDRISPIKGGFVSVATGEWLRKLRPQSLLLNQEMLQ